MDKDRQETSNQPEENMIKDGTAIIESAGEAIFCLTIIGQIEGHYVLYNTQKATK